MPTDTIPINELRELKAEIAALRSDMNRFSTDTSRLRAASLIADFRSTCAEAIASSYRETGCEAVGNRAGDCARWEKCRPAFAALFDNVLSTIRSGELTPEATKEIYDGIASLRARAPIERCESCFAEAENQLSGQIRLLETIGVGRKNPDTGAIVRSLPEEEAAALFSDALASPVRIQVIKACYDDGKTFTDLSRLTGLRGGNLLFHLEKLIKSGIIHQKGDRGEYRITYRGSELAGAAAELFNKVR
ncbi:hypothetical protein AZH53_07855 [Methanomicrobiaceae archaeon CYW5]|nr:hypothetical protein [Methanovulcanius yangii]